MTTYPKMIYWNVQKIVRSAAEEALWSLQGRRRADVVPDAVPDVVVEPVVAKPKSTPKAGARKK